MIGRRNENNFPRDHEPLNPNAPAFQTGLRGKQKLMTTAATAPL
jgi:hypothetical protein